ncbi:Rhombotin-1 [Halotydeus destructor]|nr:Rhombotin-1 [Halotydeus destructor]
MNHESSHNSNTSSPSPSTMTTSRKASSKRSTVSREPVASGSSQSNAMSTPASAPLNSSNECFGCRKVITERYLLKALDHHWHEDCLKCSCCDCRLGEVGSTLFTKGDLVLCKRDYLRLFGTTGLCSACNKTIPAFEMVMRAKGNVYHLECFACQQCNHRFCVGDRFYLLENKVLCEYDYEERMVFASLPPTALDHIKRANGGMGMGQFPGQGHHEHLETTGPPSDGASSGYGSHSESPYCEHR